jgi:hypothetical protein
LSGVRFTFLAKPALDAPKGGGCSDERNDPPGQAGGIRTKP